MARVIEEKVVGSMHIGAPGAAPAPPPFVPTAPARVPYVSPSYVSPAYRAPLSAEAVRTGKTVVTPKMGFLDDHKKIKKFIDKEGKKYLCPTTDEIVGEVGLSAFDVRLHLDVMKEDEAAVSVQKGDNPAICSADGLNRLVDNLRKLRT